MAEFKKTPLYDEHIKLKAQMAPFAGFLMPIKYESEKQEHLSVRNNAGLFDVSHMGEIFISGKESKKFLQHILTNDLNKIEAHKAQYTLMLNDDGGIIDDLIVYNLGNNKFLLCVNANNIDIDFQWLIKHSQNYDVIVENKSHDFAQVALQGPKSLDILKKFDNNFCLEKFAFKEIYFDSIKLLIARTGYTGEDGFEIFVHSQSASLLWQKLLKHGIEEGILPCGLAARDTLRLEAGLLLHGQDIDIKTSPKEAKLMSFVDTSKDFIGKESIKKTNKLIAFRLLEPGIPRNGYLILDANEKNIGYVTSGSWPPTQKTGIGLGYITIAGGQIFQELSFPRRRESSEMSLSLDPSIRWGDNFKGYIKILIREKPIEAVIIKQRNFL